MTDRIKKLLTGDRIRKIIIIAGIAGVALIFISNYVSLGASGGNEKDEAFSVSDFGEQTESELEALISQIEGAGQTKVMLTVENSVEYVYLKDSSTKTKEVEPKIRGVLVVCEGGGEPVVVERVTQAVAKALDISTAKICVAELSV